MCYVYSNDRMFCVYLTNVHVGQCPKIYASATNKPVLSSLSWIVMEVVSYFQRRAILLEYVIELADWGPDKLVSIFPDINRPRSSYLALKIRHVLHKSKQWVVLVAAYE